MGEVDKSRHPNEMFRDFCEMAYCALVKAACPFFEQRDQLEAQYMEAVGWYPKTNLTNRASALSSERVRQKHTSGGREN